MITTMRTSVFYNRSLLHHLIIEVIRPFIAFEKDRNTIENWCVYLSNVQGDHISLFIRSANSDQLQKKFSERTQKFLDANPSSKNIVKYPLAGFFMDYPNNSIQVNNVRLFPYSPGNNKENREQAISQAIVDALGNDLINTANIYTFLIYMLLGIIKTVYPAISKARDKVADLLQYVNNPYGTEENSQSILPEDHAVLIQLMENNKKVFPEIIYHVWDENADPELTWLYEWIHACRNFIAVHNFNQNFFLLSRMICRHLGLGDKTISSLSCRLIFNSFNSIKRIN